jgi:glycosyltransferase involved in cell wall biosynthesis
MKVQWLYPENRKCGISIYSHDYMRELKNKCTVIPQDISTVADKVEPLLIRKDSADLVHIQYETSFFLKKGRDFYFRLLSKIKVPVIVTLHEVYEEFPQVFPKSKISGRGPLLFIKQFVYDYKHPLQTAYLKHCSRSFGADLILVHHRYHKDILIEKGIKPELIEILQFPVKKSANEINFKWKAGETVLLGSTGFINPGYDYQLLFSVLEKMESDWKFIWIGGLRNNENEQVLENLKQMIISREWQTRFIITGWVSDEKQNELLEKLDIYLSLFKYRSSSATVSRAIGALKPVIATEIPMIKEMNECDDESPVLAVKKDPESVIWVIRKIMEDSRFREDLLWKVRKYSENRYFSNMAERLLSIYGRFCR